MEYAIFDWKEKEIWALIIKKNKNGTCRVKISNNWKETITPKMIVSGNNLQIMKDNKRIK